MTDREFFFLLLLWNYTIVIKLLLLFSFLEMTTIGIQGTILGMAIIIRVEEEEVHFGIEK